MTDRIVGYDAAKVIAILLLFPVHSSLSQINPSLSYQLLCFLLGVFFYCAGFFSYTSLLKKDAKTFLLDKMVGLYLPYAVFTILSHVFEPSRYGNTLLADLAGLGVIAPYALGSYNLWFIPGLLLMLATTALYSKKDWLLVVEASVFTLIQIVTNGAFLNMNFVVFFWVFLTGYFTAKKTTICYYFLAPSVALSAFFPSSLLGYMTVTLSFTLAIVIITMLLLTKIRIRIPGLQTIAESTNYIYLLEPLISGWLLRTFYDSMNQEQILPPALYPFLFARILITAGAGIGLHLIGKNFWKKGVMKPKEDRIAPFEPIEVTIDHLQKTGKRSGKRVARRAS